MVEQDKYVIEGNKDIIINNSRDVNIYLKKGNVNIFYENVKLNANIVVDEGVIKEHLRNSSINTKIRVKGNLKYFSNIENSKVNTHIWGISKHKSINIDGLIIGNKGYGKLVEEILFVNKPVFLRPALEIYGNNIQMEHKAISYIIEEKTIQYIMSRGFSREESVEIIIDSFINMF